MKLLLNIIPKNSNLVVVRITCENSRIIWFLKLCSPMSFGREESLGSGPKPPLRARDFMASNPEHLEILKKMGVSLIHLKDGRVQLVQHAVQVRLDSTCFLKNFQ